MLDFGESNGAGTGLNRSEGEEPMHARQADADQALLSREPVGAGQHVSVNAGSATNAGGGAPPSSPAPVDPPTAPEKKSHDPPQPPPTPAAPIAQNAPPEAAPQVQVSAKDLEVKPEVTQSPPDHPQVDSPKPAAPAPPKPQPEHVQVAAVPPSPVPDQKSGAPSSAGMPLPPSDSDSDPFSRVTGTMVFQNGRLVAQHGRKVKTVRPQIGIAGEVDALGMISAVVVVEVHINAEGEVTQVELFKRSGSVAIDERTRDAVYHWVFEPTRDKAGKPIRDVVYFAIEYR
jgi:TonB family protein